MVEFNTLVKANAFAVIFHTVNAVAQTYLSNKSAKWEYPVTITEVDEDYDVTKEVLSDDPRIARARIQKVITKERTITKIPLGYAQLSFTVICALAHIVFLSLSIGGESSIYYSWIYDNQINYLRWFEYFFSSAIMMTNIAGLTGIKDVWHLLAVFVLTAVTNLFGLMVERTESTFRSILLFCLGFLPFVIPWLQINDKFNDNLSLFDKIRPLIKTKDGEESKFEIPSFVKYLIPIMLSIYLIFPVIQISQITNLIKYETGELYFIMASLIAKTVLSWMVFGGAFRTDPPEYLEKDEKNT